MSNLRDRLVRHLSVARDRGPRAFCSYLGALCSQRLLSPKPAFFELSHVHVEPTTLCNLSCPSCISQFWDVPRVHMELVDFRLIIDRLPPFRTIYIQGIGEPLLAPDLLEMIRIAAAKAMMVSIVTNGQLIDGRRMATMEQAGCSELVVSIDSVCETLPSPIHAVEPALTALSRVNTALRSGLLHGRMSIIASVSLHPSSTGSIVPTLEAIAAAGIKLVRLDCENRIVRNHEGSGWYQGRPSIRSNEAAEILENAAPVIEQLGMSVQLGWRLRADLVRSDWNPDSLILLKALEPRKIGQCLLPWTGIYVTVRGEVTPCCHIPDPAVLSFGNILRQSFVEIAHGAVAVRFRSLLRDRDPPAFCRTCPCFEP